MGWGCSYFRVFAAASFGAYHSLFGSQSIISNRVTFPASSAASFAPLVILPVVEGLALDPLLLALGGGKVQQASPRLHCNHSEVPRFRSSKPWNDPARV